MKTIIECRDKFVSRPSDVAGHVAFSLYVASRVDHHNVDDISDENFEVPDADVVAWKNKVESSELEGYRSKFIKKELPAILEEYRDKRLETLSETTIKAVVSNTRFWISVLSSVIGWLISLFVLSLAYLSLDYEEHLSQILLLLGN